MSPTIEQWLASRDPVPPPALAARMQAEFAKLEIQSQEITPKLLSDAGASILASLDQTGCTERSSALDLLAADALFTYAFEEAARSCEEIAATARDVLKKVISA